jgi:hypothetical protein
MLVISDPIDALPTQIRKATQSITATNIISPPANVKYQAGGAINLNPGFLANTGAVFEAKIGTGCDNSN